MKCPPCNNNCNQGRDCPARICQGKHKYVTLQAAELIIGRKQGAKMMAYKCAYCAYVHIKDAEPSKGQAVRVKK